MLPCSYAAFAIHKTLNMVTYTHTHKHIHPTMAIQSSVGITNARQSEDLEVGAFMGVQDLQVFTIAPQIADGGDAM